MPELIECPECGRKLKVPETLQGKSVKCPGCQAIFTAKFGDAQQPEPDDEEIPPARRRAPKPEEDDEEGEARPRKRRAVPDDDDDEREEREGREEKPRRKRRPRLREPSPGLVTAPAICLLILGILALLMDGWNLVVTIIARGKPMVVDPNMHEVLRRAQEMTRGPLGLVLAIVHLLFSMLIIAGASSMLSRRMYAMAIVGSIVAMVHLQCFCCALGIPFGIWSLVILLKSEVKNAFQ